MTKVTKLREGEPHPMSPLAVGLLFIKHGSKARLLSAYKALQVKSIATCNSTVFIVL